MLPLILTSIVTITQPSPKPPILTLTRTSIHFTDSFLCRGFSPERGTEFREDWLSLRDTCSCSYWSNIGCLLWRPSSHFSSHVYEKVRINRFTTTYMNGLVALNKDTLCNEQFQTRFTEVNGSFRVY